MIETWKVFSVFLLRDRGSRRGWATIYFIRTEDRPQKSYNGQLVLSVQGFLCQLKSLNKSIYLYFKHYNISDWNVTIWLIGEHSAMEKINWLSCVTVFFCKGIGCQESELLYLGIWIMRTNITKINQCICVCWLSSSQYSNFLSTSTCFYVSFGTWARC